MNKGRKFRITIDDETYEVGIEEIREAKGRSLGGAPSTSQVSSVRMTIDDETYEVGVEEIREAKGHSLGGAPSASQVSSVRPEGPSSSSVRTATATRGRPSGAATLEKGAVCAVSPCTVISIKVQIGDPVNTGDTLLITESMKMQTAISAKTEGKVKDIHVQEGQFVKRGSPLVTIE